LPARLTRKNSAPECGPPVEKVAQEHLGSLKAITREQRIDAALGVLKELGGAATFRERMENILSIIRGPIPSCRFEIKKSPR
jgi:hypothetical protein